MYSTARSPRDHSGLTLLNLSLQSEARMISDDLDKDSCIVGEADCAWLNRSVPGPAFAVDGTFRETVTV